MQLKRGDERVIKQMFHRIEVERLYRCVKTRKRHFCCRYECHDIIPAGSLAWANGERWLHDECMKLFKETA